MTMTKEAMTAELHRIVGEATKGLYTEEQVKSALTEFAKENGLESLKSLTEAQGKTLEEQEKTISGLKSEIVKLKESNTKSDGVKEGVLTKFFKEKAESFEKNDKTHSANMTIKAAELMTTANITPETAGGFSPLWGNFIDASIGSVPKPDPIMMSLITVKFQPGTEKIYYSDRVNEEGDAEFIGEGELKPLIDAEWQTSSKDIKEVAEFWKHTTRLEMHAPSVISDFRTHANELIELKIDDKLIEGDESVTPEEPDGILTLGVPFIAPAQLANTYDDVNIWDAICALAVTVRLANFKGAITAGLNTVWEAKMKSYKNADGDYIIPPFVSPDGTMVGEVKVVFSNQFPDDKIIVGDWKKFNAVIAENIMYDEGYENDDFRRNLISKKLEAFLGTYMKDSDAGSIIVDDIATIFTQLELTVTP